MLSIKYIFLRRFQSLIGKVQLELRKKLKQQGYTVVKVSIPYRKGITTAFTPFVIAIIHQTPYFCNVFLKKVGRSPFLKV